jgi:hypothetical protein
MEQVYLLQSDEALEFHSHEQTMASEAGVSAHDAMPAMSAESMNPSEANEFENPHRPDIVKQRAERDESNKDKEKGKKEKKEKKEAKPERVKELTPADEIKQWKKETCALLTQHAGALLTLEGSPFEPTPRPQRFECRGQPCPEHCKLMLQTQHVMIKNKSHLINAQKSLSQQT